MVRIDCDRKLCTDPSIRECLTYSVFFSKLKSKLGIPTVGLILLQYAAVPCVLMNSFGVGKCGSFVWIWVCFVVSCWIFVRLFCPRLATTITGIPSLISESSVHYVESRSTASDAWCWTPVRSLMSKLYFIRRRHLLTGFPVARAKLKNHFNAWCSVRTMILVPSRYARRSQTPQTTAWHTRWVVSKFDLPSFKIFAKYLIGWLTLSSCFCINKNHIRRSHASVSGVYHTSCLGRANIGRKIGFSCKVRIAVTSSSLICPISSACILRSLAVNSDAMRAKLRRNRR